jgi:hypothetical protein
MVPRFLLKGDAFRRTVEVELGSFVGVWFGALSYAKPGDTVPTSSDFDISFGAERTGGLS